MVKTMIKIGKMLKDKTGVSPIIAIILMVAITVVLAATIYVWVSGFGGGGSKALSMSVTQLDSVDESATDHNATFRVDSVSQGAQWSDINISVRYSNGTVICYVDLSGKSGAVQAGDTFSISTTSTVSAGDLLQVKDKTSNSIVLTKTLW